MQSRELPYQHLGIRKSGENGQARAALIGFGDVAGLGNEGHVRLRLHVEHLGAVLVAPGHERVGVLDHGDRAFVLVDDHVLVGKPAFLVHDELALQTSTNKQFILRCRVESDCLRGITKCEEWLLERRLCICGDTDYCPTEIARTHIHPLQQKLWYFQLYL